ncbi:MAG: GntR family transcriptional regulator [Eubacteriales bacterium]|nr:GntR family transcriptional regulator [Eubacteriales bacterium]
MRNIIQKKTLREQVADIIRKKILHHELKTGMRITESELAKEFGVSHGPVREALRQLEQEGLLEYTRNVGCSVRNISLSDVIEALLIRGTYELTAARACAGNISDEGMQEMSDILSSMETMDDSDFTESINFDNQFHKVLIREAHMPYLLNAWSSLDFAIFFSFSRQADDCSDVAGRQYQVHKELYDIYKTRNCTEICNIIYKHYITSIEKMLKDNHVSKEDFPFSFDMIKP